MPIKFTLSALNNSFTLHIDSLPMLILKNSTRLKSLLLRIPDGKDLRPQNEFFAGVVYFFLWGLRGALTPRKLFCFFLDVNSQKGKVAR